MSLPRDNNPTELKAFDTTCQRLGGFDDRVSFEWVDGFLTALAAGPGVPPVEEWLPAMCGDAFERAFADPADHAQALKSLRTRLSVLADQLDAEALIDQPEAQRLQPLMAEWTDEMRAAMVADGSIPAEHARELLTGGAWADGFFDAIEAFDALWPSDEAADDPYYSELLMQVQALAAPEDDEDFKAFIAEAYEGKTPDRDELIVDACFAVQELRVWHVDHAPKPATRRVEPAPGRNDPCPCGSGKKFKKCHGA